MILHKKIYKIEKKDNKLYIQLPYNDAMKDIFRSLNAKWKSPYWIAFTSDYDIILNELKYYFGEPDDLPVDLKIDVNNLVIRDKLFIAGLKCIEVDVLEKRFVQTSNLYIYDQYTYNNWEKHTYKLNREINFFTRLLVSLFRPFKVQNSIFLLTNISKTRAQNFIDEKHSWVKSASIVPAKNYIFID